MVEAEHVGSGELPPNDPSRGDTESQRSPADGDFERKRLDAEGRRENIENKSDDSGKRHPFTAGGDQNQAEVLGGREADRRDGSDGGSGGETSRSRVGDGSGGWIPRGKTDMETPEGDEENGGAFQESEVIQCYRARDIGRFSSASGFMHLYEGLAKFIRSSSCSVGRRRSANRTRKKVVQNSSNLSWTTTRRVNIGAFLHRKCASTLMGHGQHLRQM